MQIPRMIRGKPNAWDPQVCLAWGDLFLSWLRAQLSDTDPSSEPGVWRVRFTPRSGATLTRLGAVDISDVENGEDRVGFLPKWYWEKVNLGEAEPEGVKGGAGTTLPSRASEDVAALTARANN
jgi:RAT1-interacting protein